MGQKSLFIQIISANVHTSYLVRFGHGGARGIEACRARWAKQPASNARERLTLPPIKRLSRGVSRKTCCKRLSSNAVFLAFDVL